MPPHRSLSLVAVLLIAFAPPAPAEPLPLPRVDDGWKAELVTRAPEIVYPTAIVAAPDGTIYLGQDPMDMPGPPTEPIDSVVALKDGKVRTFVDKLWSVMGLEWTDGTLYVVHAPYLSAFRDADGDGRADERVDLISGLGPKVPGFNGINEHVASGIRLGMDGFLYIAVGDKGIPKGVGKDGTTIRLFGGGVIRIRPDGTRLEVVSTGERNPLSVALSAADDVFTFGNDDDSKRWPNSLTHHIVGGHYGYPYQFLTAPERALPIVAGQFGGAGAQGICFEEDGLPAAYRGNLFFCDWGRQAVYRYQTEKAGGTFRVKRKSTLVSRGDLADFRPFSLGVAPDGTSLLLVDWGYNGWLARGPKTGRLFRLTYEGGDRVAPAPRPKGTESADRIAALDHPARSVRLEAQRAFVRQGSKAVPLLTSRLRTKGAPNGRCHAIWALDAIGTPEARAAIRAALGDPDSDVRLQAVRSAGVGRDRMAESAVASLLSDPDAAVRREAAIALGAIGDRGAAGPLYAALGEPDTFAAWSVRQAIRRLNAWDEEALVAALLDPNRRDAALKLADEAWAVPVVNALAGALRRIDSPDDRARVVATLAGLAHQYPAWSGYWFGTNPLAGPSPRKTVPWAPEGMTGVLRGLALGLGDKDLKVRLEAVAGLRAFGPPAAPVARAGLAIEKEPPVVAALARVLGALHDSASAPVLGALVQNGERPEEVRAAALEALGQIGGPEALRARFGVVFAPNAPPTLVARALPALGREGVLPPNDVAAFLESPAPAVRAAALAALSAKRSVPLEVEQAVVARLDDADASVRKAAIEVVGLLKVQRAVPRLLALARSDGERPEVIGALAEMPDPRALPVFLTALNDRNPELRRASETAIRAMGDRVAGPLQAEARSGRLTGPAAAAVERLLARFSPVVAWRVVGPFPRTTPQLFLGERSIDFGQAHKGVEGRTVSWTPRHAEPKTGRVVLDDLKGGAGDRGGFGYDASGSPDLCAFAFAEVVSDRDRSALLLLGSSGTLRLTLNEQLVYQYVGDAGRPYAPDSDTVRVALKKGTNRILAVSRQGIGVWSFSVKVSDPSGPTVLAGKPKDVAVVVAKAMTTSADELRSFATTHQGDPKNGEQLFFDPKGIGCARCHTVGGKGSVALGPDLAGLALKYDKAEIIRSVLDPSDRIAPGYQPVVVALRDGTVLSGLVRSETDTHLELLEADAKLRRIAKTDVTERRIGEISIMPKNVAETLSRLEFADLISYLTTLKTSAPIGSENRR